MKKTQLHPSILANYESKLAKLAAGLAEHASDPTWQAMVADQIACIVEYRSALRLQNARAARRATREKFAAHLEIAELAGEHEHVEVPTA